MPSSRRKGRHAAGLALAALVVAGAWATAARAQQPQGFAVERFQPAAPGGGWLVMDDLDLHGGLGGAFSFSTGYARDSLRVTSSGGSHLSLVEHQAFYAFGAAVTYDRFRLYLDMSSPLVVRGQSGTVDSYQFPPGQNPGTQHDCGTLRVCADVGWNPDTVSDPRIGLDARLLGDPKGPFRLGFGAQLYFPSGVRSDYLTDGTFRAMARALFAGDVGRLVYAAHVGVHVRPLDDAPAPGSPHGSELLFGVAAGPRFPVSATTSVVVGPEIFGETALRSFLGGSTTGLEALLSGRFEGTDDVGAMLRVKAAVGGGLHPQFGAPEWRVLFAVEAFGRVR
jgi:OOP family OmpA-OmpF porin